MKRIIAIILSMILFIMLAGCTENDNIKENSSTAETITETIYKAETAEEPTENKQLSEIEVLSEDDKAVKAEIAKYSESEADFRANKQEIVNGKTFDLKFSTVDAYAENKERVIYNNTSGDTFEFDIKTGRLRVAEMNSLVTAKANESIDKDTAQNIAEKYAATKCDINNYTLTSSSEIDKGYTFVYKRYIGGYPSSDKITIWIGYNGEIIYISDYSDTFLGKDINYDKAFIDSKIKEYIDETKVDWDSIEVCVHQGKVSVNYRVPESHAVAICSLK